MKTKKTADEIFAAIDDDVEHDEALEAVSKMSPAELASEVAAAGIDMEKLRARILASAPSAPSAPSVTSAPAPRRLYRRAGPWAAGLAIAAAIVVYVVTRPPNEPPPPIAATDAGHDATQGEMRLVESPDASPGDELLGATPDAGRSK